MTQKETEYLNAARLNYLREAVKFIEYANKSCIDLDMSPQYYYTVDEINFRIICNHIVFPTEIKRMEFLYIYITEDNKICIQF